MDDTDYEKERLANIEKNKKLLQKIGLPSLSLAPEKRSAPKPVRPAAPKKKVRREPVEVAPRRSSARLAGHEADSSVARRIDEERREQEKEFERLKRLRRAGDFRLDEGGEDDENTQRMLRELARLPFDREEFERESKHVGSVELKAVMREMGEMQLFQRWPVNDITITPARVYWIGMHPSTTKPLVFAGDTEGNLGIWDVFASVDEGGTEMPFITSYKLHRRCISQFLFSPTDSSKLYTASYDTTIRVLDLTTGTSTEVYFPADGDDDALIPSLQLQPNGNVLLFSNILGRAGKIDLREPKRHATLYQVHEKKVGGISISPSHPDIFATCSLDRTMKLWDLRRLTKNSPQYFAEHVARLSISSAEFNRQGDIVSTCYDDTLKIFNSAVLPEQAPHSGDPVEVAPSHRIVHNNQTGRFLSVFKAHWHANPENNFPKFCVGNMNRSLPKQNPMSDSRGIDVYSANGELINHFEDREMVKAVPAVVQFHPQKDWIVAGNASGKVVAFGVPEAAE
jgi:WD repeat-containing protein 76